MPLTRRHLLPLFATALILVALAGCATSGGTVPPGSTVPGPPSVSSPEDAAALVIASDPRFAGAIALKPDVIGASRWWEAAANADGSYNVKVTLGWGDCPAGCINHHSWTYRVTAAGAIDLVDESGDPVPASLAP